MRVLVTSGNTLTPIDRVRAITNIFTGRTGTGIALHCFRQGHSVVLLTSHPDVVAEMHGAGAISSSRWAVHAFRTFDDLQSEMEIVLRGGKLDVVIHCAAVSDFRTDGVYSPAPGTSFHVNEGIWTQTAGEPPRLLDRAAGKIKSDADELWLRLVRTPKLIDHIRLQWGFRGILVKFKLEVGIALEQLLEIAERSRRQSDADLMVANTLEGAATWAIIGPIGGKYERVERPELPARLLEAVERLHRERSHG
jgi:phosphopantothenoylcysteine synthetase/decarboxylase